VVPKHPARRPRPRDPVFCKGHVTTSRSCGDMEIDERLEQRTPRRLPESWWCRNLAADWSPDLLVVVDPDLRAVWTNPAVAELLGYTHGEMWGSPVLDFVHPEDLDHVLGAMSEAYRRDGYHIATQFRIRQESGAWISTRTTASTVSVDGSTWVVLSIRSVHDEVAIEQRRRRLKALAQSVYVECAGMQHHEEEHRSTAVLATLGAVLGANSVELAEFLGEDQHLLVRSVWGHKRVDLAYGVRGGRAQPLSSTSTISEMPCVLTERGQHTFVEISLPAAHGHSGVVCLGFSPLPDTWDDANADLVALMCSTLLATVARCSQERKTVLAATRDPLTGLLNRRALHDRLGELMAGSDDDGGELSLVVADLNNFKRLNDTRGHHEGDLVLVATADAIMSSIRAHDIGARVGGDEFVVVVHSAAEATPHLIERLRHNLVAALGAWDGVGVAIGAITVGAHDTPDDVLRRADLAMYLDKAKQKADPTVPEGAGE